MRAFAGHAAKAAYVGKHTYSVRTQSGSSEHFAVRYLVSGEPGATNIGRADFKRLPPDEALATAPGAHRIWADEVGPGSAFHTLGEYHTEKLLMTGLSFVVLGGAAVFVAKRHRHKRWYEGKLAERKRGPLPAPTGDRFWQE